ncbi:MAG: transcriptional regulator, TetR family [Thermoleophilia bacterium]|nr:transcriptional regulator, TetR family [Thermoleophilia bacterium]MCZ4496504.1 transcriptional regulator, TetR family [Thermoleophilia bacterium]
MTTHNSARAPGTMLDDSETPDTSAPHSRSTAAERRERVLEVAMHEFSERGYEGGSTQRIAAAAGISQAYVFQLYGSKPRLFLAVIERCMEDMLTLFETASSGRGGSAALRAVGDAYLEMIANDPVRFQMQLVGYASCAQPDVRAAMRTGFGRVVELAEQRSGLPNAEVARFFADGMLLNVVTAMGLTSEPTPWGARLIDGSIGLGRG